MSLLEDIKAYFGDKGKWPGSITGEIKGTVLVEDEIVDTSRWSIIHTAVYKRDEEYVGVDYHEPATESQNWEDWGAPDVYPVHPEVITVTVTKFTRLH